MRAFRTDGYTVGEDIDYDWVKSSPLVSQLLRSEGDAALVTLVISPTDLPKTLSVTALSYYIWRCQNQHKIGHGKCDLCGGYYETDVLGLDADEGFHDQRHFVTWHRPPATHMVCLSSGLRQPIDPGLAPSEKDVLYLVACGAKFHLELVSQNDQGKKEIDDRYVVWNGQEIQVGAFADLDPGASAWRTGQRNTANPTGPATIQP